MDVSEMFALPKLGSLKNKRKLDSFQPSPSQMNKAQKVEAQSSASTSSTTAMPPPALPNAAAKGKAKAATIEDGSDEEDGGDDERSFAPGNDSDYFIEEDDEGRMYGGGLTDTQKRILEIMDDGGDDEADAAAATLTLPVVRKKLLDLEKAINKNREQRTRYASDPSKFVDSEVALDATLHELLLLTQDAGAYYPELVRLNIARSLIDLLSHENVDVAITVIEVLEELTDDDVAESEDEDAAAAAGQAIQKLIDKLLEEGGLDFIVQHLARLDEKEEPERQGVYHALGLLENLISAHPPVASMLVDTTTLLPWLLKRTAAKPEASEDSAQNRQYAGELIAILLQSQDAATIRVKFGELGGVDTCLTILARYRKRDPRDNEEVEYMENLFDALCSALAEPSVKQLFLDGEGVELMIILMKERKLAKTRSIKVLDHALTGDAGSEACVRFVDQLGLKTLFPAFMGKGVSKKSTTTTEDEEHVLGILVSLLSNLASDTEPRIRLLAKFVSDDYEKVDRLLEVMDAAETRVARADAVAGDLELDEDEAYLQRLEAGLSALQMAAYVLAWICMEDDGVRDHAKMLLSRKGSDFGHLVRILDDYRSNIGDGPATASSPVKANGQTNGKTAEEGEGELTGGARQRDIISHLTEYLRGC